MSDTIDRADALRRIVLTGEQMAGASSSDVVDAIHRAVSALPIVNAREAALRDAAQVAGQHAEWDEGWATKYPDEAEKMRERSHRARSIRDAILALIAKPSREG